MKKQVDVPESVQPITCKAEFIELAQESFPLVTRRPWEFYTSFFLGMSVNWRTRSWQVGRLLSKDMVISTVNQNESFDMSTVRHQLRLIESGLHFSIHDLGRAAWNALSGYNNMFAQSLGDQIINWNPDIHSRPVNNPSEQSRLIAAEELTTLYAPRLTVSSSDQIIVETSAAVAG